MPQSRRRKTSRSPSTGTTPNRRRGLPSSWADDMCDSLFEQLFRTARDLLEVDDPLQAECWASELLGQWHALPLIDTDPNTFFGGGLVRYAARRPKPQSLVLLRALGAVAPPSLAGKARTAARQVAAQNVRVPGWVEQIGQAKFVEAWVSGDEFKDQEFLVAGFAYGSEEPRGIGVLIDNLLGGIAKDVVVGGTPSELARGFLEHQGFDDEAPPAIIPVDAAFAAGQLVRSLDGSDRYEQDVLLEWMDPGVLGEGLSLHLSDDFRALRALLHARRRTLQNAPGGHEPEAREAGDLVGDFFAAPETDGLRRTPRSEFLVQCLVEYKAICDRMPLRWSPAETRRFLLDWTPWAAITDDETLFGLPDLLVAWIRYAGRRVKLDPALVEENVEAVRFLGPAFADAVQDPELFGPTKTLWTALRDDVRT